MNFQARQQLGTILLNAGKIDEDQLQAGLRAKQDEQGYIGCLLYTSDAADDS